MTRTLRQVINDAGRMVGEVNEGQLAASAYFANEVCVPAYNGMIHALFGHLIGPRLTATTPTADMTVEEGVLYEVGGTAVTLTLPDTPQDGWWFGISDSQAGLSAHNVTIAHNTWLLEGSAANITLSTNGLTRQWFFRADTGNWQRVIDTAIDDTIWFPDDIVRGLPAMLAMEVTAYGFSLLNPTVVALQSNAAREKISQRYASRSNAVLDPAVNSLNWRLDQFDINKG